MHKRTNAGLLAALGWAVLQSSAMASSHLPGPSNYVNVYVIRVDDVCCPLEEFLVAIDVVVPGVAGVSAVTVETDAFVLPLEDDGGGVWGGQMRYANLDTMWPELDGTWTVIITGASPSTSTFTLNANQLKVYPIFLVPTDVVPANGESGVPADVVFAWNDPTGTETADVLFVFVDSVTGIGIVQEDDSINGTLSITDTTWDPPINVPPGQDEFGVYYADFPCLVGQLNVTPPGSITWDDSPFAPPACPTSPTPLLVLGSGTIVGFDVCPWNCGGDNDGNVGIVDFLAILAQWGQIGTSCDFGSGAPGVGINEFLDMLAHWGPCP